MPLYNFHCPECGKDKAKLRASEAEARVACVICECGEFMERAPQAPSARVTEVLDNGSMVRKLERLQNAQEVYRDHANFKPSAI